MDIYIAQGNIYLSSVLKSVRIRYLYLFAPGCSWAGPQVPVVRKGGRREVYITPGSRLG